MGLGGCSLFCSSNSFVHIVDHLKLLAIACAFASLIDRANEHLIPLYNIYLPLKSSFACLFSRPLSSLVGDTLVILLDRRKQEGRGTERERARERQEDDAAATAPVQKRPINKIDR